MRYVLARGESGLLYLYEKRTWEYLQRDKTFADTHILTEVAEGDDPELLRQMQSLVNKDLEYKDGV